MRSHARLAALLLVLAPGLLGAPCKATFNTIRIDAPAAGALIDDSSVALAARAAASFTVASLQVRLDGVDLGAALGLTPPFLDQSGIVMVGGIPVQVSGFSIDDGLSGPTTLDLTLASIALGDHLLEVEGTKSGVPLIRSAPFSLLLLLDLAASGLSSGALRDGPVTGAPGQLFNASIGQALASEPISFGDGTSVRSGIVEVGEAFIAAGTP